MAAEVAIDAQFCPGCGVPTIKADGCNHVSRPPLGERAGVLFQPGLETSTFHSRHTAPLSVWRCCFLARPDHLRVRP
jgi:hypothetical protein